MEQPRFKELVDLQHYWKDAIEAPHIESILFLTRRIIELENKVAQLDNDVDNLLGSNDK